MEINKMKKLSNLQIVAIGYSCVTLIGTLLLLLPVSSNSTTTFTQAFFTSVSASCVTGLAVVDTALHWTLFGQIVILLLIQVGGMGFMTIGVRFMMMLRKRISLKEREIMVESINGTQIGGILSLAKKIVKFTFTVELLGAALLSLVFVPEFGVSKGVFYSVFHAISAFCNAGFDLMGYKEAFSSLVWYSDHVFVNFTMYSLITLGGIGFIVWQDLDKFGFKFKKYSLHSKLVLSTSLCLSLGGGILFFIFEYNNLGDISLKEKMLSALFHSISCRTAGFNTIDIGALTGSGSLLTMLLMFIGGSPSSTAGGIKTTTVAVIFLYTLSTIQGKKRATAFGRSLEIENFYKAIAIVTINLTFAITGILVICAIQPDLSLVNVAIEVSSAIGTAGLTTGITRELSLVSTYIIAFLMFCGRVGSVSLAGALMEKRARPPVELPKEKILVG